VDDDVMMVDGESDACGVWCCAGSDGKESEFL